ncbi:phage portal protein family protein [Fusobacterium ulcerans]|uniref:phage portal protein family protein n=1 Tax=Fusobacterium ulcerans TaxID=861 RepID=UPI003FED9872
MIKIKKEMFASIVTQLFSEKNGTLETISNDVINKIMTDIDIASAIQKLERAVSGRKLVPIAKKTELKELEKEIQERFSGIKFNRIINHLITARYYGYSCFEIVYKKDFSIDTLIPISAEYIYYRDKKWKLRIGTEEIVLNRDKFLLSIHKWNPAKPEGTSIFECCHQTFLDKDMYVKQLRGLASEYGDIIIVYPFDINMNEEEKEELRKNVENLHGKKSIGVPVVFSENFDLGKTVEFIKLSDLDPKIYTELENREKEKLVQNILGSTLTIDNGGGTGSYSLGEIHKEGFDEVVEEICKFVTDSLFQLLEIDSKYHGYNPKDFEFTLEKIFTEEEKIAREKQQEELKTVKLDNLQKLSSTGYKVTAEYISEHLGISLESLIEKPEQIYANGIGAEFSKKKLDDLFEKNKEKVLMFEESISTGMKDFTETVTKQLKEKFKEIKNINDLESFSFDLTELKEKMIIAYLKGYIDELENPLMEFSSDEKDPFNLPFSKAINWFIKKFPILYDHLDDVTKKVNETFFYIKRSLELETTRTLYNNLLDNLSNGGTLKDWLEASKTILDKTGLGDSPWYLELVYRNNMQSSYNAGAFYNQELNKKNKPYGLYDAIDDERTSEICQILNGKVYPLDDPFWNRYLPPNHHGCRSKRITLSREELEEYGLTVSKNVTKEIKELKNKMGNFYGTQVSGIKKAIKQKEKEIEEMKNQLKLKI